MTQPTDNKPRIIDQPVVRDRRGNLSFIQSGDNCPLPTGRVYWVYDMPADTVRHGRALRSCTELIVAMSGAFDVETVDATGVREKFHLDTPAKALLLTPMTWRTLDNFSSGCVAMVIASDPFDEDDYIRDFDTFITAATPGNNRVPVVDCSSAWSIASVADRPDPHATSGIDQCRIIPLPRIRHANGSLTPVQPGDNTVPFDVKRVFHLFDVPGGAARGGHSHFVEQQFIVALAGEFKVTVDDGVDKKTFTLNRPYEGLYIPPGIWRTLGGFSGGSVALVLSSMTYDESDYVRRHTDFVKLTKAKRK